MFYNEKPGMFNEDHLRLVTAAATQLAKSMNSAELYGLIRDQAERLGAILRQEQVESTKNSAILNSVADGVMYANEKGVIRVFNNTAERILAVPGDQVFNKHIDELTGFLGEQATKWLETVKHWMANPTHHLSKDERFVEEMIHLEDGRTISVRLSPVNMGDQFLGTVSVFRDITREVEVDRLKSEFVATVSHELRTPMTSIKGYADLLLLGAAGAISETQQRFLQTIKQNADRLSILVNDLLEVSRIDQGRMPLRFVPVDVNEIMQTIYTHLQGRMKDQNKPLNIRLEAPDGLPPIRADYDKIVQVIQNIADNAFNYTPNEGAITLKAQYVPDDNMVMIIVSDTGIGIPEEAQSRIFERFYRGDEYSELVMDTPGTGLGLAIVKELVNMHSGIVDLDSAVGEGTTFYIKIPVATESESADSGEQV
jgi:PAS domain S-box-containing protein